MTLARRFLSKVKRGRPNDCWEWQGTRMYKGYGHIAVRRKFYRAHRVAWVLHHRQRIPKGMFVCHTCDNPPCCNPAHLFLGTNVDNMQDMLSKGRQAAKLTENHVRWIRKLATRKGITQTRIARLFGVSQTAISHIIHRKLWRQTKTALHAAGSGRVLF
jgi:predicted XRE-type DNA-binding protein